MANFTKFLVVLLASLSCLLLEAHAARTPEARVWSICKPTTSPLMCYKTILPQVLGSARFNVYKVLEIEVLATQKQASLTLNLINTLLAAPGISNDLNASLSICQDQYGSMMDSITDTIKQVDLRNAVEARFKFSAVLSNHGACHDAFTPGVTTPIDKEAMDVYNLGSNCLDIMKAIEDKESRRHQGVNTVPIPFTAPTYSGPCLGIIGICN